MPAGRFPTSTRVSRPSYVIRPEAGKADGAAPGNGFLGGKRIPGTRDACGDRGREGGNGEEARLPRRPAMVFPRRA